MAYKRHENKKEERQVVVIDKPPEPTVTQRSQNKICMATTMSGKQCSFKAVCGDFCKKHRIDKEVIGKKIPVYSK
jgi:sulfatase maturation enzyme AslB (radical SAM superfamily)